ncbi:4'-phosphopantetheinyl transferase superfamily protein [Verminephrobacter aporrectodeae subsp. tuberculatae]|uniref:4'-phosphopantetheinyl transferase family protein n=1 Tax=Verminephrobacter aporrectodeae TaxID=1110389 RepID=UPI002243800A|nr:4'-phosphopantetheinyl transferase superfamily protein [Verminephrobacter aporrectodeae]MCW8208421.1 4'-phosphopantetheinyl transferase superfamily protein [Verminephrobacter aporrectodeae subsp. tuberculatae]
MISLTLQSVEAIHAGLRDLGVGWLSPAEQGRLSAMTATRRRAQFIAGHWLARHCLAARAGGHWQDYALSAPDDAAPHILAMPERMASGDWYFSLSHSGDWLACAVARHPVGVDVECSHRPRNFQALNEWIHEPSDRPAETTPQEQQARFYAQWTLKEAWIKQVPPSMPRPRMKSVRFAPCDAASSVAVVGQNPALTLAVYPATPASLQCEEAGLPPLEWTCWNHAADPLP